MALFKYLFKLLSRYFVRKSWRLQQKSPLRDLTLWGLEVSRKGHMSIGEMDLLDLVEHYGSPLLVVNKKKLVEDAQQAIDAFQGMSEGSKILYSYKTNCIPGILREMHGLGIGAEVISPYELWLAEQLDVPGEMIVYNGVSKSEESIRRAIERNILAINIDFLEEIDLVYRTARRLQKKARVGVRLGFVPTSQFGLDIKNGDAMEACKKIAALSDYLELNCVHFNVTSNARSASTHKFYAEKAVEFMHQVKLETGITVAYLDVGGGFGVETTKNMSGKEYGMYRALGCLPPPPSPRDYQPLNSFFGEVIEAVKVSCAKFGLALPKIIIEPGRLITSKSELMLTRVNAIKRKEDGTMFALTDAGRLSLTFPCDFEYHEVFVADRPGDALENLYHIMGRVCTSADWMFKNRALPRLKPGDVLAVMDAGAYFSSYSSNFAFPRPDIVMVDHGQSRIIRKQEGFEHLTAVDIIQ